MSAANSIARRFAEIDLANPIVWAMFERFTFEMIRRGFQHYSADAVLHRVRWETAMPLEDDSSFKINNNWSCCYARKFRDRYPAHAEFFRLRVSQVDADWPEAA
jgi:hypothetical protein